MKICRTTVLVCLACLTFTALLVCADNLIPPGPPGSAAAAMKTLNQIEPRVLIESLPTTITNPGSYYIMANLTVTQDVPGVSIGCRDVNLDLGGNALLGMGGGSSPGVLITGPHRNILVENGVIRDWGWEAIRGLQAVDCHVKRLSAVSNALSGIVLSTGALAEECIAVGNGGHGFQVGNNSTVRGCTTMYNTNDGINAGANTKIYDCTSASNGGDGVAAGDASRVKGCTLSGNQATGLDIGTASAVQTCMVSGNTDNGITAGKAVRVIECNSRANKKNGIFADDSSIVLDCISSVNEADGIQVTSNCRVEENNCVNNGRSGTGAGIHATGSGNRIDNNNVSVNVRGVKTSTGGSIVLRNTAHSNGTIRAHNYDLADDTYYGRIPLDILNVINTDEPWVNFSF